MKKRNEFVLELLSQVLGVMEEYEMVPKVITIKFDVEVGFVAPYNAFSLDFQAVVPEGKP